MRSAALLCLLPSLFLLAVHAAGPLNDAQSRWVFGAKPNHRVNALRKRQASISSNSTSTITSTSDAFCRQFSAGCVQVAMQGKLSGQVQLVQSCQKTGDANTYTYAFGCKADGVDVTQIVLDATGTQITLTLSSSTVTTQTLPAVTIASTLLNVQNVTARVNGTSRLTTFVSAPTTVSTTIATQILLGTNVVPSVQVTLLSSAASAIPTALGKRLFWRPAAPTSTSTTSAKATATSISSASSTRQTLSVSASVSSPAKTTSSSSSSAPLSSASTSSTSPFCSAFAASCTNLCGQINSSPQVSTCTANAALTYTLQCYCRSQQSIVSYVLNDVAGKFKVPVQQIKTITSTSTIAQPNVTSVQTSMVTNTVATVTSIATTITTITSVVPVTASSTTQVILAPTGRVAVRSVDGSLDGGYLTSGEPDSLITASLVYPNNEPINFMAVRDSVSGSYQLQVADGSGDVLAFEMGFGVDPNNYGPGSSGYAFAERVSPDACAGAGQAPSGSGAIVGNACTSFVWSPTYNSTLSSSLLDFKPTWLSNGVQTQTPTTIFDNTGYALLLAADPVAYAKANQAQTYLARLMFPA